MGGSWRTISVALRADTSGYVRGLATASGATRKFGDEADRAHAKARSGWESFGSVVKKAGLGLAVGFVAFTAKAISSSVDFEKRISAIGAVSGASGAQMDQMRAKALQLGADTVFSASDAARAMEELVKAGIPVAGVLGGAADATVALAAAGEVDLPQAATIAANAMNAFGLTAKQMPRVADMIAGVANASAIDVSEFGFALQSSGAVAHLAGFSFDDLSVAIAELGNAGIKGQDAGTSLKSMFLQLSPATEKAKGAMARLGIITADGTNRFFDATGKARGLADIQGVLAQSMRGLSKEQQIVALKTMFGTDAVRAAAIMAQNGSKGFDKLAASMGKVKASDVAKKRMDNLAGSVEQLKGSLDTLLIKSGSVFTAGLRGLVDGTTVFVNALSKPPTGFFDPLISGAKVLRPAWDGLVATGKNLWTILGEAGRAAEPVVVILGKLGAAGIVGGIRGISAGLEATTGFLARNEFLVRGLVAALAVLAGVKAFNALVSGAETLQLKLMYLGDSLGASKILGSLKLVAGGFAQLRSNAAGGLGDIKAGLAGLSNVAGFAVMTGAIAGMIGMMQSSRQAADDMVKSATQNIDTSNIATWQQALGKLNDKTLSLQQTLHKDTTVVAWGKQIFDLGSNAVGIDVVKDSAHDAATAISAAKKATDEWAANMGAAENGIATLTGKILGMHGSFVPLGLDAKKIGGVNAELHDLAKSNNIDLTKPFREWGPKLQAAYDKVHRVNLANRRELVDNAKTIGVTLKQAVRMDPKELKKQADELRKYVASVYDAVSGMTDLTSIPEKLAKTHAGIRQWMATQLDTATRFTKDISIAISKGLDPAAVSQLLKEGPAKAGAILHEIVKGDGTAFIQQYNQFSKAMEKQAQIAAAQARLTRIAIEGDEAKARELSTANQIVMRTDIGAKPLTAAELAKQLGISPENVKKVAQDFKLQLAADLPASVPGPKVGVDTSAADSAMLTLRVTLANYGNQHPEALAKLDATDAVGKRLVLDTILAGYAQQHPEAKALLNSLEPEAVMRLLMGQALTWEQRNPTTQANLLHLVAMGNFASLDAASQFYDALTPEAQAGLNKDIADRNFNAVQLSAQAWQQRNPTTQALLVTQPADRGFTSLAQESMFYASLNPQTVADLNKLPADQRFAELQLRAQAWRQEHPTATIDADNRPALSKMSELRAALGTMPWVGSWIAAGLANVGTSIGNKGAGGRGFNARGNLYEPHHAQIARAGEWRVWAEPETGGEAYVPLAAGKRPRSKAITEEVVRRFGGQVSWQAQGGLIDSRVVSAPVAAAYGKAMMKATAWHNTQLAAAAAAASAASAGVGGAAIGPVAGGIIARVLATIRSVEAGNNYTARNPLPGQTASGAYQFTNGTWNRYGGYPAAYLAPPAVQDARAAQDARMWIGKGGVPAVPVGWYVGHFPADLSQIPPPNKISVGDYQAMWMRRFDSTAPAGAPPSVGGRGFMANGGLVMHPGNWDHGVTAHARPFDDHGTLARGWNLVRNNTGGDEHVVRIPQRVPNGAYRAAGAPVTVTVNAPVTVNGATDVAAVEKAVSRQLAEHPDRIVKAIKVHERSQS